MPKYLCLQRRMPAGDARVARPSPSEMEELYARFEAWATRWSAELTDPGGRLGAGRLVTADPAPPAVSEVRELVGGYMIVTATDLAQAIRIASECPGLVGPGSAVELIEIHTPK
jgi:hypothetical protein